MTNARELSQHLNTLASVGWELQMARRSGKVADINNWTATFNKIAHTVTEQMKDFLVGHAAAPIATSEQNSFPFCDPEAPKQPQLKTPTPVGELSSQQKKKKRVFSVTKTGGFRLTKWMKDQFGAIKGKHYTLIRHPNKGTRVVRTLVITNHQRATHHIWAAPTHVRKLLSAAMDEHLRHFGIYEKTVGVAKCLHIDLEWDSF